MSLIDCREAHRANRQVVESFPSAPDNPPLPLHEKGQAAQLSVVVLNNRVKGWPERRKYFWQKV
jgi:hypothetical protein